MTTIMKTSASEPSLREADRSKQITSARKKLKKFQKSLEGTPEKRRDSDGLAEHRLLDPSSPTRRSSAGSVDDDEDEEETETESDGVELPVVSPRVEKSLSLLLESALNGLNNGSLDGPTPQIPDSTENMTDSGAETATEPTAKEGEAEDLAERTSPATAATEPPPETVLTSEQRIAELTAQLQNTLTAVSAANAAADAKAAVADIGSPSLAPPSANPESIPRRSFSFLANIVSVVPSDPESQPSHPQQRILRLEAVVSSLSAELEAARRDRTRVVEATNYTVVRLVEELKHKEAEVEERERKKYAERERELNERIAELEGFVKDMADAHSKAKKILDGEIAQLKGRIRELQILASSNAKPPTAPSPSDPQRLSPESESAGTPPAATASASIVGKTGADVLADSIAARAVTQLRSANAKLRKDVEDAHGLMDKQQEKIEDLLQERDEIQRELVMERSRRTSFDSDALGPLGLGNWGDRRRTDSVASKVMLARNLVASPVTTAFPSQYPTRPPSAMSQGFQQGGGLAIGPGFSGGLDNDDPLRNLSNRYNLLQQQHHALAKRLEEQASANRELKRLIVQASLGPAASQARPPSPTKSGSGSFFFGRKSTDAVDPQTNDSLLLERFAEMQNELAKVRGENEALRVRVGELEWAVHEVVHEAETVHQEIELEAAAAAAREAEAEKVVVLNDVAGEEEVGEVKEEGGEAVMSETVGVAMVAAAPPAPVVEEPRKPPIRRETLDALKEKLGVTPLVEDHGDHGETDQHDHGHTHHHDHPHTETGVADSLLGKDLRTCCSQCGGTDNPVVLL